MKDTPHGEIWSVNAPHPRLDALVEAAARAMATQDGQPPTERVLREYREDARVVVEAVLAELKRQRRLQDDVAISRGGVTDD